MKVVTAQYYRLQSLRDPRWIPAMVAQIKRQKFFRWHDAGDLQGAWHLKNIFEVCKLTPSTKHWLPTREAQIIKRVKINEIPRNLVIRFSSHMINQAPVNFFPWTSTVVTDGQHSCPASTQGNSCGSCRQCWNREEKNVSYPKH